MLKKWLSPVIVLLIITLTFSACGEAGEEEPLQIPDASATVEQPTLEPLTGDQPISASPTTTPVDTEMQLPADQPAETLNALPTTSADTPPIDATQGPIIADLGFRPGIDSFPFPNYGNDVPTQNLTPVELRRMFGDIACAALEGDQCVLPPPGEQYMEQLNGNMANGHCEGLAVLSLLLYSKVENVNQFGAPDTADLSLDNETLQREIAYWWTTQDVAPTTKKTIQGSPQEILEVLKTLKPGSETYTLGIYKRDGTGGHAITPFAVEDQGNGLFAILVYDNNYPKETRRLMIDTQANTWSYEASVNPQVEPDLYEGDAETKNLELTPTSVRLQLQECPYCAGGSVTKAGNGLASAVERYNEVFLDGDGSLLITDEEGRRLGFDNGKVINEIPGAEVVRLKMGPVKGTTKPVYWLPETVNFSATIDGSTLKNASPTDLVMIGPGFSIGVEGITLQPGQKDTAVFFPKDELISYETDSTASPNIVIGVEYPNQADYYFEIQGAEMQGGGTLYVSLDTKSHDLLINTDKLKNEGKFNLIMTRIDPDGKEDSFYADEIALKAGALIYIDYSAWKGNGTALYFGVDLNGDGTIDEEYQVDDIK